MSSDNEKKSGLDRTVSRRGLLGGLAASGGVAAGLFAGRASAAQPDPLITDIQDWNRYLGDGVDSRYRIGRGPCPCGKA